MSVGRWKKGSAVRDHKFYETLFNSHVKLDDSGCHLWTAAKNNIGYGMFRYKHGMATSHRVIMDLLGYDIVNKIVYHTCDNYNCVNPDHLRIGTRFDKAQMMASKGHAGKHWKDPKYFKTCPHCNFHGSPAVIGHFHNDKCKNKP